jgi:hypothetical protein
MISTYLIYLYTSRRQRLLKNIERGTHTTLGGIINIGNRNRNKNQYKKKRTMKLIIRKNNQSHTGEKNVQLPQDREYGN